MLKKEKRMHWYHDFKKIKGQSKEKVKRECMHG